MRGNGREKKREEAVLQNNILCGRRVVGEKRGVEAASKKPHAGMMINSKTNTR